MAEMKNGTVFRAVLLFDIDKTLKIVYNQISKL